MENIGKLIPILFEANEDNFFHNGLGRLNNLKKNEVTEVLNGEFELELEYPTIENKYALIKDSMLILAKPNKVDDPHLFRIYEHELTSEDDNLLIKARSINMDLASNVIVDVVVEDATPEEGLLHMKSEAIHPCNFTFTSDITTKSSTHWTKRSLLNCIAGEEGSIIQIWGGEIKHLNKHVIIYKNRGKKNVTTIRHARNLKGLKVHYSVQNLITSIVPYYTVHDDETDEEYIVVGNVVNSQYINNYPHPHCVFIEFNAEDHGITIEYEDENGEIIKEKYIDLEILNEVAETWFEENSGADVPVINLTAELEDLSQMEDYERFRFLEEVNLGDTVTVYSEKYQVDITSKVIKIVYDGLSDKVKTVEIGQKMSTGFQQYREIINRSVKPIKIDLNNVMIAANKKNKIFRGPNEPEHNMIKNDIWYKPVGEGEVELYRFDGAIWRIELVSGGLIKGTLDAGLGDLDIINLNANNITTGSMDAYRIVLSNEKDLETALEENLGDIQDQLSEQRGDLNAYINDQTLDATELKNLEILILTITSDVNDVLQQIDNESAEAEDLNIAADDVKLAINTIIISGTYNEVAFAEMLSKFDIYRDVFLAVKLKIKTKLDDSFSDLENTIDNVESEIAVYQSRLTLTDDDITMTVNGMPVMKLSQNRLSFYNEGEEVSYFAGQQLMIDNALVIKKLQVGNHSVERQGTDFTVFRWVGSD